MIFGKLGQITHQQKLSVLGILRWEKVGFLLMDLPNKTDKTPVQEIELAKRRKEMYFSRQREML